MDKIKEFSYDQAMQKLENIVNKLENGNNTLDEDIKHYQEGMKLCEICKQNLEKASLKIEQNYEEE